MKKLLEYYSKKDKTASDERRIVLKVLIDRLKPELLAKEVIDYNSWMEQFIVMIQPDLNALRMKSRTPKDISNLFTYYRKEKPLTTEQLKALSDSITYTSIPSERVAACIIGVGDSEMEDLADEQFNAQN